MSCPQLTEIALASEKAFFKGYRRKDGRAGIRNELWIIPTAKISTNSALAANKPLWIDFNAGAILDGASTGEVDKAFVDFVLEVASGEPTNNEKSGYSEIAILKSGVTL